MANKKAIIKAFGAIKTIYPYFGKESDLELLVNTWAALLQEYTEEDIDRGLFMALKTCKHAPVPADIIEQIENFRQEKRPCEGELWALYHKALRETLYYTHRLQYNYIDNTGISQGEQARRKINEIWENLPPELKIFLGAKAELVANAKSLNYTDMSFERSRLARTLPVLHKRVQAAAQLEETKKYLLEGF